MSDSLFPEASASWAGTRDEALQQLRAFVPLAGRYGRDRNHVVHGHTNVSRLSPAIRHRLILESECVSAALQRFAPSTVEKFVQEVYWRRYWKCWLSLRPQIWSEFLDELSIYQTDPDHQVLRDRAGRCEAGRSGVAIMNHFARELIDTGYLHNHARMWFAGWWIHIERLPWQLGADFFYRHLLDGDPASNTLSWRWVAGLQTPGKTYLPRRTNLEKYLPADLLAAHSAGLDQLERPTAVVLPAEARPAITRPSLSGSSREICGNLGIWLHEEDLFIEDSPLRSVQAHVILATGDSFSWNYFRFPERKQAWIKRALTDASTRAGIAFGLEPEVELAGPLTKSILSWAKAHQLSQVAALRPDVGPLNDQLRELETALREADITLVLLDRSEDLALRPLATGGFFSFWEKMRRQVG